MKRTFSVPENLAIVAKEAVCTVIEAIPLEWAVVRGFLSAPEGMLASGEALASTRLVFGSQINRMVDRTERGQVADVFAPELSRLDAKSRSLMLDSLDLAASWASWDNLRTVQGCSVPRARQIVSELLTDLLATVPRARRN